jgi:hypothetical protein
MGIKVVAVTGTKYTNDDQITRARAEASRETFAALKQIDIPCVVCDGSFSNVVYRQELKNSAVIVVDEPIGSTMGSGRRLVMQKAFNELDADYVLWLEPEKTDLVKHIPSLVKHAHNTRTDILLVGRTSLRSYPRYQQQTEGLINEAAAQICGLGGDSTFGPRLLSSQGVQPYLDHPLLLKHMEEQFAHNPDINPCKDLWDSIYIPAPYTLMKGDSPLSIAYHHVDFTYPIEQRKTEEYDLPMAEKRYIQAITMVETLLVLSEMLGKIDRVARQRALQNFKQKLDSIEKPAIAAKAV